MHFSIACVSFIIFGALIEAGHIHLDLDHLHHHHHGHDAISYSVVANHEDLAPVAHEHQHTHYHEHFKHHDHHGHHHEHLHEHLHNHVHEHLHDGLHGQVKYEFQYGVKDPKTGDIKDQWESRDGDAVKGAYSLKEADGTTRVVKYTADDKKGFEATVHTIGHAEHDEGHK